MGALLLVKAHHLEMAETLPKKSYPLPSPQPSKELLESSWGLDLTPERDIKPRGRIRKSNAAGTSRDLNYERLSVPQLNSTAVLSSKIQKLKLRSHHPASSISGTDHSPSDKRRPVNVAAVNEDIADLEVALNQKPVTEVNVPRHISRYSNLVSVEVSDVCFQKPTAKPSKKSTRSPARSSSSKEESDQGPSLMELFSPDLEWEEAEWNVDTNPYASTVESSSNALNYFPSSLYTRLYQS